MSTAARWRRYAEEPWRSAGGDRDFRRFLGRRREGLLGGLRTIQDRLGLGGAHRDVADARQGDAGVGDLPLLEANHGRRTDHGEVAVPTGYFLDGAACARFWRPYPDLGQDLIGLEGGREESGEEVSRIDHAYPRPRL